MSASPRTALTAGRGPTAAGSDVVASPPLASPLP